MPTDPGLIELVARAGSGDLAAQAELVHRYRVRIAGFVRPLVRTRDVAEELAQVTAIKMVRRLPELRDPARFESWLFRLARNTALDHLRRTRCRPATVPYDPGWHDRADAAAADRCHEIREALDLALRGCDRRNRRILSEAVAGSSYAEIAARERLGVGAIKVRLHRLRLQLRASLRPLLEGELTVVGNTKERKSNRHPPCR